MFGRGSDGQSGGSGSGGRGGGVGGGGEGDGGDHSTNSDGGGGLGRENSDVSSGGGGLQARRSYSARDNAFTRDETLEASQSGGGNDGDADAQGATGSRPTAVVVALYGFTGDGETQLTLHEGDCVEVLEPPNADGWAWGRIRGGGGTEGYFPIDYTEEASPSSPRCHANASSDDGYVTACSNSDMFTPDKSPWGGDSPSSTSGKSPKKSPDKAGGFSIPVGGAGRGVGAAGGGGGGGGANSKREEEVMSAMERMKKAQKEHSEDRQRMKEEEARAAKKSTPFERNTLAEKAIGAVLKIMGNDVEEGPKKVGLDPLHP